MEFSGFFRHAGPISPLVTGGEIKADVEKTYTIRLLESCACSSRYDCEDVRVSLSSNGL